MKKVFLFVLGIVMCVLGIAQPITQRSTSPVTVQDARLFAQFNFRPPVFIDTVDANANIGIDSCGALIFARSINAYYYRACSPKRWVAVAGGQAANAWLLGGNNAPISTNLGTLDNKEITFITNSLTRMRIAGTGINRSSTPRQKYLSIDTANRYLYYTDGTDTASLSSRINQKIDSLKRNPGTDSVFAQKNGQWVFQYKDSIGGGGSTPSLQQVTDVDSVTTNPIKVVDKISQTFETTIGKTEYNVFDHYPLSFTDYNGFGPFPFYNDFYIQSYKTGQFYPQIRSRAGIGFAYEINFTPDTIAFKSSSQHDTYILPQTLGPTPHTNYLPAPFNYNEPFDNPYNQSSDTLATLQSIRRLQQISNEKYIDSLKRTPGTDSVFAQKNGQWVFQYRDSVGVSGGGGGGGKIYYFNGGVSMGTFGGIPMYELGDTAVTGAAANFTRATTGNIANFITDVNKPGLLQIPAGVWTIDAYLSETGGGSNNAQIYAKLEKWNGSTITTIATSPIEQLTSGNVIDLYTFGISVPTTTISATDRIVIQFYIQNTNGKTVTLYTQNGYVGEVHTTFTTGIGALNGLTASSQTFAVGTSGTDFNISSATSIHTFNLPTASATNRGALSSANWSTFNSKIGPSDTATMLNPYLRKIDTASLSNRINLKLNISDTSTMLNPYLRKIDTASLSNRINTKLNITDTTAFDRKSAAAFTFRANNTSSTANVTDQVFRDSGTLTYTGTITWTGTTAPSGATSHRYRWCQIGKQVTITISLNYANAGAALTAVKLTLPAGCPNPTNFGTLTAANDILGSAWAFFGTSTSAATTGRVLLQNNAGNNGYEFNITASSGSYRTAGFTLTYFTD